MFEVKVYDTDEQIGINRRHGSVSLTINSWLIGFFSLFFYVCVSHMALLL